MFIRIIQASILPFHSVFELLLQAEMKFLAIKKIIFRIKVKELKYNFNFYMFDIFIVYEFKVSNIKKIMKRKDSLKSHK